MNKKVVFILARYIIAVLAIFLIPVFYFIFKPLTLWLVYFILGFFYKVSVSGSMLIFQNASVEIIDACVAGSAYYLLLALNLITRGIGISRRILLFLLQALSLFILNIIRLLIIIPMFLNNSTLFDFAHKFFWYALSIVFVFIIWLFWTWLLKIKAIPFYSDVKWILKNSKRK